MIAIAIVVVSSVLFSLWWFNRDDGTYGGTPDKTVTSDAGERPAIAENIAKSFDVKDVLICGKTLLSSSTGTVISKNWLKNSIDTVFYYDDGKKLIARIRGQYLGMSRDGKQFQPITLAGSQIKNSAFSNSLEQLLWMNAGDIWRGEINWDSFEVENPVKITDDAIFNIKPRGFPEGVMTKQTVLIRDRQQIKRVDVSSGDITTSELTIGHIRGGASPDGTMVMISGELNLRKCLIPYEIDTKKGEPFFPGKWKIRDLNWLNADICLAYLGNNTILRYDKNSEEFTTVEMPQVHVGGVLSLRGLKEAVAIISNGQFFVVRADGSYSQLQTGMQMFDFISEDTYLFTVETGESATRGTYFAKIGEEPKRLTKAMFTAGRDEQRGNLAPVVTRGKVAYFLAENDIWRVNTDGSNLKRLTQTGSFSGRLSKPLPAPFVNDTYDIGS